MGLARKVAEAMDQAPVARDGFVMTLIGQWGSQKPMIKLIMRCFCAGVRWLASVNKLWGETNAVGEYDNLELMAK